MSNKQIFLWRWAKPAKVFEPKENPQWFDAGIKSKFPNGVVLVGLNPIDWMEIMGGEGNVLHKIVLNKQQAELCVVAEASFRPIENELTEFIKRKKMPLIGSLKAYQKENYKASFVCLLKYSGGYNLPEVLIPFPVKAEVVSFQKLCNLIWKIKMWFFTKDY